MHRSEQVVHLKVHLEHLLSSHGAINCLRVISNVERAHMCIQTEKPQRKLSRTDETKHLIAWKQECFVFYTS